MNYFEFYQIPLSFRIDDAGLRRIFYAYSKKYHPDFHTLSTEADQEKMLELATLNNEAYKTLSDQDLRTKYILQIKGLLDAEDQPPQLPQDFLMDMMDVNETLMELEFEFEPDRYRQTLAYLEQLENELLASVQPILETFTEPGTDSDLQAVKDYYFKKKYLLRIRENLSKFAASI